MSLNKYLKMKKQKLLKFLKPKMSISESLAIVGSSKSILKKEFGREIDSHQDVIRFNRSQVKNFEKFVGSKTTVRFVNNPVFECCQSWDNDDPQDINFVKLLTNIKIAVISPHKIKDNNKRSSYIPSNQYFFLENQILKYVCIFYFFYKIDILKDLLRLLFQKKTFSVGFSTILLCIISGIKPALFGFDLSEDMNSRSHYWEVPKKPGERHNLNFEHIIIKKFADSELVILKE